MRSDMISLTQPLYVFCIEIIKTTTIIKKEVKK